MSEKFQLQLEEFNYESNDSFNEKFFENLRGKWHVIVQTLINTFKLTIVFIPSHPNPANLKNMPKIHVEFNSVDSTHNSFEKAATQIPNTSVFEVWEYANALNIGHAFFAINIEITFPPPIVDEIHSSAATSTPSSNDFFEGLLESGKFADVTIKTADDKEIKAHSWILARSKVFDAMLHFHDTIEAREKVININDIEYELMMELLRFIYCDKVPKLEEMAKDLLALADRYEIPALLKICSLFLIESEDIESIAEIFIPADNMKIYELKDAVINFAIKNRGQLASSEGWKSLKATYPKLALEVAEKMFTL